MEKFLGDNWGNHVKTLLDQAMKVCIATAFLDLAGIKILKDFLDNLPNKGGRRFNFLLGSNFHEDEYARQVIINELLTIPNTEVRIYDGNTNYFHPKLYIFYSGNEANVLVGSVNATGAGLTRNIEAGIVTTDPQVASEAKIFFNSHWELGEIAEYTPDVVYISKKFKPGDRIKDDSGKTGLITTSKPELVNEEWNYEVFFSGEETKYCMESGLTYYNVDVLVDVAVRVQDQDKYDFIKNLLFFKLAEASDKNLFSYQSSRTDCNYYQFRPLMQMLRSSKTKILIADDVGLGKTIEAGIILSEYRARRPKLNKILVICPKSLQTKWESELEGRFDEYFDIINKRSFLKFVDDYKKNANQASIFGIASYGLVRSKDVLNALELNEINFDMVIIDEAHYLRNTSTLIHKAARIIGHRTSILVMLTATPIQLRSLDLLHLLQILDPETFISMGENDFYDYLSPNKYFTKCLKALDDDDFEEIVRQLQELMGYRTYRLKFENNPHYLFIQEKLVEGQIDAEGKGLIRRAFYDLNTLNQYVTRTRKSDVGYYNQREVTTLEYQYTPEEQQIYFTALEACRRKFQSDSGKKKTSAFDYIMPERQASSCLPAYVESIDDIEMLDHLFSDIDEESEIGIDDGGSEEVLGPEIECGETLQIWRDTKYNTLVSYIMKVLEEEKNQGITSKFVIFSYFKATIRYLIKMLNDDFGDGKSIALRLDGSIESIIERERIVNEFENNNEIRFLICSEVASEGIDMHRKCHRLINYDLPWNPMKLEQRIGRIDRYGQLADKVFVVNLICKDNIEDKIYAKLYERVTVFENSLGPLENVLGKIEKQIVMEMLNPNKTDAEKKEFLKKMEENIATAQLAEDRFSSERIELTGLDEYFNQELSSLNHNKKYFTEEEVRMILKIFLDNIGPGNRLEQKADKNMVYSLYFSPEVKKKLIDKMSTDLAVSPPKLKRYLDIINLEGPIICTFNNDEARDLSLVYMTIHNPIIKAILKIWQDEGRFTRNCNISIVTDEIPAGLYCFFANHIKFAKGSLNPSLHIYNVGIAVETGEKLPGLGDILYQHIVTGKFETFEQENLITEEQAKHLKNIVTQSIDEYIEKEIIGIKETYALTIDAQIMSLEMTKNQKINEYKKRQSQELDQRKREHYEGEIRRTIEEHEKTCARLSEGNDFSVHANSIAQAICLVEGAREKEYEK